MKKIPEKISFKDKFSLFNVRWQPKVIAEMNDYQFKLVKVKGEFVWHSHKNTDETFIIIKGTMNIELSSTTIRLNEGEMFVVPKGTEHKPYAESECMVMIIEPKGVINTGNAGGDMTANNNQWI